MKVGTSYDVLRAYGSVAVHEKGVGGSTMAEAVNFRVRVAVRSVALGAKKKPRATAGLKLNERYEERPDRARARPTALVAGSRLDGNVCHP